MNYHEVSGQYIADEQLGENGLELLDDNGRQNYECIDSEDLMGLYLKEIEERPEINNTVERIRLLKQIQAGNHEARERMVEGHLWMVMRAIDRYRGKGVEDIDLFQEGAVALVEAVKSFSLYKNTSFHEHVLPAIDEAMESAIMERSVARVQQKLEIDQVAEEDLTDKSEEIEDIVESVSQQQSIELFLGYLSDPKRFSERERFIIESHYGLNDRRKQTLEKIGAELGFSAENARRIEKSAFDKIRLIWYDAKREHY